MAPRLILSQHSFSGRYSFSLIIFSFWDSSPTLLLLLPFLLGHSPSTSPCPNGIPVTLILLLKSSNSIFLFLIQNGRNRPSKNENGRNRPSKKCLKKFSKKFSYSKNLKKVFTPKMNSFGRDKKSWGGKVVAL